jgi:hypothetical protein
MGVVVIGVDSRGGWEGRQEGVSAGTHGSGAKHAMSSLCCGIAFDADVNGGPSCLCSLGPRAGAILWQLQGMYTPQPCVARRELAKGL